MRGRARSEMFILWLNGLWDVLKCGLSEAINI